MPSTAYLRFPHLQGDLLAFVAEDDVWLTDLPAPGAPARAWRVTSDRVPAARPRISPDGTRIAWTGRRDGPPEAYWAPVDGGAAVRLTYGGDARTGVLHWLSDDEVGVLSGADQGHRAHAWAHAVPVAGGGVARRLPFGPVRDLDVRGPGGAVLLHRGRLLDSATWKRYRGGTAGKLWLDPDGKGEFVRFLAELDGNLSHPMWIDGRAGFLSDHEGVAELYTCLPDGTDLRRHTHDPAGFYARNAATDGGRVVFQRAGRLWLLDGLDAEARPLDVRLPGALVGRARRPVATAGALGAVSPDRAGAASAVEVRGTVHWLTHKDGPTRALLATDGVRGRLPVVLGESGSVAWVSDEGGEDALEIGAADGTGGVRRILAGELGRVTELASSPDGRLLAVVSADSRLLVVDVASGAARTVTSGLFGGWGGWGHDRTSGPVFSPDSAWLAWSEKTDVAMVWQIRLADVATLTAVDVTGPRFRDWSPAFTADGRHLAFLSTRTFDSYDAELTFDLAFTPGTRPYLVPLAETEPSPFAPWLEDRQAAEGTPETVVDVDGLMERIVPFPVPAGVYTHLSAAKGGLLWLAHPVNGVVGDSRADPDGGAARPALHRFDLARRTAEVLVAELDSYAVSGDGARITVRDGEALRVLSAESGSDEVSVDLDRIRVTVDPTAERTQSYHEAWRLQRDNYFRPDMAGVDWAAVRARYEPLVAATGSHDDFVDVLWELFGELGTSHAYVGPPALPTAGAGRAGMLGADLVRDSAGLWRIGRILPGDASVPAARSPLTAPGVAARPGDAIVAVDGCAVPAESGPFPLLVGKVGKPVELTLVRDGAAARRVLVVPTASETLVRYHAGVAANRAHVLERSGGRLGYLHLPDQQHVGWSEFHRDLRTQIAREGLIVDTRGNAGGYTSQLVVEKLIRRPIAWMHVRGQVPEPYPVQSPLGPVVSVCDEWTGSDGDMINQAFKEHGIPVVGVRTWGGVIGIDERYRLVDGTAVTQPKYAFSFDSVGLGLENHGCEPTVEVHQSPQDFVAGRDPQLDTAIRIALDSLAARPARTAPEVPELPGR
ncbi:PDZ domain-containing protein [Longispora sp. K20-0274]|uniref:S41 family peptidase n=1 Tax=Longispora sp. K20-0274 TaxID=3088255 RepID=UPI00399C162C